MNSFEDIPYRAPAGLGGKIAGSPYVDNLNSLSVGAGVSGMRIATGKGMWFGAKAFVDAPVSIDLLGNINIRNGDSSSLFNADTLIFYESGIPVIVIGEV